MTKGHEGETCSETLKAIFQNGRIFRYSEAFTLVKEKGEWTDETICEQLMACVVNLSPARLRWPGIEPFLFLHEDGRYELFDYSTHGVMRDYWLDPMK